MRESEERVNTCPICGAPATLRYCGEHEAAMNVLHEMSMATPQPDNRVRNPCYQVYVSYGSRGSVPR